MARNIAGGVKCRGKSRKSLGKQIGQNEYRAFPTSGTKIYVRDHRTENHLIKIGESGAWVDLCPGNIKSKE